MELNNLKEVRPVEITPNHPKEFRTNAGETGEWLKPTKDMKSRLKEYEKGV